jgi:hypothetical protein
MLEYVSVTALADLVGDGLMVLVAVALFILMWLTVELLERV